MTRIVNPISPSDLFIRNPISPFTGAAVGIGLPPLPTGGLLGHWDSSDPDNTDAVNDGDPVGLLKDDLSGLSNDMTQTTGAQKPIYKTGIRNGLNVIRYDGVDDHLFRTNDSDFEVNNFSIYAVTGRDTAGDEVIIACQNYIGGGTSRGFFLDVNLSKLRCGVSPDSSGFHETKSDVNISNGWHIFSAIKFGSTVTIYRDGEQLKQKTDAPSSINFAGTPKNNVLGATIFGGSPFAPMDADWGQGAVYGIAHSDSIRDIVHSILSQKWNIALI